MSTAQLVRATQGNTWSLSIKWPYNGALWTHKDGWHSALRAPVERLLREAQAQSPSALLVSPPGRSTLQHQVAADGVRALVAFDIERGELMCHLVTVEAFVES